MLGRSLLAMPPGVEITDLDAFRESLRRGEGVVVIADPGRPEPIAHVTACRWLTEENFATKVLEFGNRNGRYLWFATFPDAQRELGARRCGHCG